MIGGTAPAVTVQTNSGVTVLFTYSADGRTGALFHDPFVVVSSLFRLCFASPRWPLLHHALSRAISRVLR